MGRKLACILGCVDRTQFTLAFAGCNTGFVSLNSPVFALFFPPD